MAFRDARSRGNTPGSSRRLPFAENFFLGGARFGSGMEPRKSMIDELKAEKERRKEVARAKQASAKKPVFSDPVRSPFTVYQSDNQQLPTDAEEPVSRSGSTGTLASPRKDLGLLFADEEKTSTLADMMASVSLLTPRSKDSTSSVITFATTNSAAHPPVSEENEPGKEPDTASAGDSDEPVKESAVYRKQATTEGTALEEAALHWTKVAEDPALDDGLRGDIRAAVGQAQLLYSKRVSQFLGLCDLCDDGPEEDGLSARAADLEGFWEVIMMQVDAVKRTFATLEDRRKIGVTSVPSTAEKCRAPQKKVRRAGKAKNTTKKSRNSKNLPATPRRKAARARLQAAKALMRKRAGGVSSPIASNRPVLTPVRATKKERELYGTDTIATPVRRSARKTPSKFRKELPDAGEALASAGFAFKPNFALVDESDHPEEGLQLTTVDENNGNDSIIDAASSPETVLSPPIMASTLVLDDECKLVTPQSRLAAPRRVSVTSAISPIEGFESRVAKRVFEPSDDTISGSVKRFAAVTPSRRVADELGTDVIYTPVRRSSRLSATNTPGGRPSVAKAEDLPVEAGYLPNPSVSMMFQHK